MPVPHRIAVLMVVFAVAAACAPAPSAALPAEPTGSLAAQPSPSSPAVSAFAAEAWPETGSACGTMGYLGSLGRIEALDARTIRFTLCGPDGAFLARIAHPSLGIVAAAALDQIAADRSSAAFVSGSGDWQIEARAGDNVRVLGPSGECFYVPGRSEQPLLLVGTGTGLAPLYGILRDALAHGHTGPIHLYHGAVREAGLYLRDELARLAAENPNVHYNPTTLDADGPVDQLVLARHKQLTGFRAFLCGDPAIVQGLRKKLFLGGMDLKEIYADAFLPAA